MSSRLMRRSEDAPDCDTDDALYEKALKMADPEMDKADLFGWHLSLQWLAYPEACP